VTGPKVVNEDTKNVMRQCLKDIQSGEYAKNFILEKPRRRPDAAVASPSDGGASHRASGREASCHDALDQGEQTGRQESQLSIALLARRPLSSGLFSVLPTMCDILATPWIRFFPGTGHEQYCTTVPSSHPSTPLSWCARGERVSTSCPTLFTLAALFGGFYANRDGDERAVRTGGLRHLHCGRARQPRWPRPPA